MTPEELARLFGAGGRFGSAPLEMAGNAAMPARFLGQQFPGATPMALAPAPPVDPVQTGATPAQKPGLMDKLKTFRDSERGQALSDMFAGWAMGGNLNESLGYGARSMMAGRESRAGKAKQEAERNQTVDWLTSQGMAPEQARAVAGNPSVLTDVLKNMLDPNAPLENEFKRVQIDNMRSQIAERNNPSARDLFGLNPQYGVDAQGNPVLLQVGKNGEAIQTKMPEGITLSKEPIKLDAGTHFVLLDPITRQPVGQIEKNVAGEAAATAGGKALGEAQAGLPQAEAGFQSALEQIQALRNHPGLDSSVGTIQGRIPDAIAGLANGNVADFRSRLAQTQGQAFLRAFESLKGGGAITELEGEKAEQAIARLNQAVSEDDFKTALDDLEIILGRGIEAYRRRAGQGGQTATQSQPQQQRLRFNPATGALE